MFRLLLFIAGVTAVVIVLGVVFTSLKLLILGIGVGVVTVVVGVTYMVELTHGGPS